MVISDFETITNFPLEEFLFDFMSFIESDYPNITNFYEGNIDILNSLSIEKLNDLMLRCNEILSLFVLYNQSFKTVEYLELYNQIEDIKEQLKTIENLSKWLRSTIYKNTYSNTMKVDYILGQNETVKSIVETYSNNTDNSYFKLSQQNALQEEIIVDGVVIKVDLQNNLLQKVTSVLDNLTNEKITGIDLSKNIELLSNDVLTLSTNDTLIQTAEILLSLQIADNPEFINSGIQKDIFVGSNIGSFAYSLLIKQLFNTFVEDDTFNSISLTGIEQKEDAMFINVNVESKNNDVVQQIIKI